MQTRLLRCGLTIVGGIGLALALLWLGTAASARPALTIRYVAPRPTGNDAGNDCTVPGSPCSTIQHAIDIAESEDKIYVAGGTYTSTVGTVAAITKVLWIAGGYAPGFGTQDPDTYPTVLDAQWGGSVISVTTSEAAWFEHLTLIHGDGTGNCIDAGCGGGIYADGTFLHLRVDHCIITDNVGSRVGQGYGGGIYADAKYVDIWQSRIVSNTSTTDYKRGSGGGIYVYGATQVDILTNTIQDNTASAGSHIGAGGGLWLGYSSSVTVAGNRIENNWANPVQPGGSGGGIYVVESEAHLARNIIVGNNTFPPAGWGETPGGGVFILSTRPVTLSNNLIARNEAGEHGGAVHVAHYSPSGSSRAILINNTIADNGEQGVVASYHAILTMTNNLVAGHGEGLGTGFVFTGTITANTNLFWNDTDPITGANALLENPLLTPDYHLCEGSPAVDAGLTVPWLTTDLEGSPRPQGSGYDIGAFEGEIDWWSVYLPLTLRAFAPPQEPPLLAGCEVFPADNIWNTPVDTLPVDANSAAYIATIGLDAHVHADFGSGEWPPGSGSPIGIPYEDVSAGQSVVSVTFDYADESDPGPYPIPPNAPIEGGPASSGDRHVLVLDRDNCMLYELFYAWPQPDGSWQAGSGAIFDLSSHALRHDGWTSADAAGLPILPGLVRYDEVAAGEIRHALRFTAPQTRKTYVWPARHQASSLTGTQYPPMGQRFRLRAEFDVSGFSPDAQVILRALKKWGMMLADNGSAWYISGAPDDRWDNDVLHELHQVHGSEFEAVDVSSLMVDPNSGQAQRP